MKTTFARWLIALLSLLAATVAGAAPPKLGWVKVELTWADRKAPSIPLSEVTAAGGLDIADYGTFRIAYVPAGAVKTLADRLAGKGIRVRERDDLDRIETPRSSIDARHGLVSTNPARRIRAYLAKTNGLYLVQFVGPAKAEWSKALIDLGWKVVRYLPTNAYVLAGPPELAQRTGQLPFVQFFDFYHPFQKAAALSGDTGPHALIFEVSSTTGKNEAIEAIAALAVPGSLRVDSYENDTYVHARMTDNDATALLSSPLIIGVGIEPVIQPSDERRSLSLTSNVTANGSQPTNPTAYASWLASRCNLCTAANMPASTWRVAMSDTGLDGGTQGNHHPDLAGREYWGGIFVSTNDNCPGGDCDDVTHGTMVASIIAGNAALGITDPLGYYYGAGVAPAAGIFSTKMFSNVGGAPTGDIFTWAQDAASHSATVQNHSHNNYTSAAAGRYTAESRQYDQATRDADNNASNGRVPMLFTVSSGNTDQGNASPLARPPATAKNVISVGGVENYRPDQDPLHCHGSLADDFRNIMFESGHGTVMAGYIKPDLVAPASMIVSAKSRWPPPELRDPGYCQQNVDGNWNYQMESGTSFAAPVAAGASILIKRYLGSLPTDVSPAGVKAVLIAGARSVRDGIDRSVTPNIPVGPIPNTQQGFGRLSLDNVLTGATRPVLVDESVGRHFTTSGQTRITRLAVRDASKPVVVTLVWTDAPATALVSNPLVNDLDLTIWPVATPCSYRQGNYLSVTDSNRGEESVAPPCNQAAPVDHVNNVEYARFFADNFSQFDVRVTGAAINDVGDPGYSSTPNQDFALVVLNADLVNPTSVTPPQLTATRDSVTPTTVHLSWTEPFNMIVDHYEVRRGSTLANVSTVYPDEHGTARDDVGLPSGVNTWVYSVTAIGTYVNSDSNIDIATTIKFDDNPIVPLATSLRAHHVEQLRQAIDAIRFAAGLTATSWLDGISLNNVPVKTQHITQMQSQLSEALNSSHLNIPSISYTPLISYIKAINISELRTNAK